MPGADINVRPSVRPLHCATNLSTSIFSMEKMTYSLRVTLRRKTLCGTAKIAIKQSLESTAPETRRYTTMKYTSDVSNAVTLNDTLPEFHDSTKDWRKFQYRPESAAGASPVDKYHPMAVRTTCLSLMTSPKLKLNQKYVDDENRKYDRRRHVTLGDDIALKSISNAHHLLHHTYLI